MSYCKPNWPSQWPYEHIRDNLAARAAALTHGHPDGWLSAGMLAVLVLFYLARGRITIQGGDHPGLIARLTEVFIEFDANIVRLNADRVSEQGGDQYVIQIDAWIPAAREHACLASISNTASSLQMHCSYSKLPAQFSQA